MKNKYLFCDKCGNLIDYTSENVSCCGNPMQEIVANTTDAAEEKHVPVIENNGKKVTVKVGSVSHPMSPEHYIPWIYLITNKRIIKKALNPNDAPEATFELEEDEEVSNALAYCNLHSLWMI